MGKSDYLNKKKILCILQLPPPVHGASMMNSSVVKSEVINHSFTIDVINLQFAGSLEKITKFSLRKIVIAFKYGFKIIRKILTYRPDLIYFTLSSTGFAFLRDAGYVFLMKLFKRKIVFHLHGKGIKKNAESSRFKKYLYKSVFKNTNVICLSEKLITDIVDVYKATPYIVPNGIPVHLDNGKKIRRSNDDPYILYLSNYKRTKGILVLTDALDMLRNEGYKFKSRFVGAPSDLNIEDLRNVLVEKKLTEFVEVTGPLYGKKKYDEFLKADIFVFPTFYKHEAFPLVILEAFQFNLPVISTIEGGIPDMIINNETGFLVETQNPRMLADKIALLLTDKKLRLQMGKKGYVQFNQNYTLAQFEKNLNKTFQSILDMF